MQHNFDLVFDINSSYWQKVLDIFNKNESFPKKVVKGRNLHHKFPKSFSKKLGEDIDNSEDNLVSLSEAEHFLVHYYYWKCARKGYRASMSLAFRLMARKALKYVNDEIVELLSIEYENARKDVSEKIIEFNKTRKWTEETLRKKSESMKGKKHSDEVKRKMSEAHKGKKMPPFTDEHRRNIGLASKGRIFTEDVRKRMSEKIKNRPKEWKQKLSENSAAKKLSSVYKDYKSNGGQLKWNEFQKEYYKK